MVQVVAIGPFGTTIEVRFSAECRTTITSKGRRISPRRAQAQLPHHRAGELSH